MTVTESLDRLVAILENVSLQELSNNFSPIASSLGIDESSVDTSNKESMINSIREGVALIEENDVEAAVDEIEKFFTEEDDDEEDDEEDEDEMDEGGKYKKGKHKKESFYISTNDIDMSEDVAALSNTEELSEEFTQKAKDLFETAVVNKVNEKVELILEEYTDAIEEKTNEIEESYAEKLDEYLDYVISEWVKENEIALESGIRSEMTESMVDSLKDVLENHYVDVPKEKESMVEDLNSKVQELERSLNSSLEENAKLHKELRESHRQDIDDELTSGLSAMQKEKMRKLLEGIEVPENDNDLEAYREKAKTIRESYFPEDSQELNEDTLSYDVEPVEDDSEPEGPVSKYAQALSRLSK